jgi:hypothetical protein
MRLKTVSEALIAEIKALREEVAGLRQEMQAMRLLEHKTETAETPRRWWQWGSADALRLSNRRRPRNELRPVTRYQRTEWGFWRWPTTARTRIFCAGSFTS